MSKKRRDSDYVDDIREAMQRIVAYTRGLSYEQFMSDTKTQDAVICNLEVIDEAVKALSDNLRATYAPIPWREMAGMRDRLIHHYFGVNYDIVWQVAHEEILCLLPEIEDILRRERGDKMARIYLQTW